MAEFVESIRYDADISDLRDKLRRIDSDHDDVARKTDTHTGKMTKAWGKVTSGIGGVLSSVAKVGAALGAAGVAAGVVLGKQAVDAASDLAESMSKVDVVFGGSAQVVKDWAKTSAEAFGQSSQQALEAAGTYGNLFQAFGLEQKPAQEMSQSLVQLAADLASFNNTSIDDALLALQSGLSGETEPLKRFGVALSDVRLKEQALAMGLITSTKDALTPAAKAQAVYALIMQDTTLAQGDFARTSDGLANKQRILAAKFEDVKAKIGAALLPAMLAVVSVIADKVIPFIGELAETWLPRMRAAFEDVVVWVKSNWPAIQQVFSEVIGVLVGIWENQLQPALVGIKDAAIATFGWLMDNKEVLIGVGVALGAGLATLFGIWVAGAVSAAAATLAAAAPLLAIGVAVAAVTAAVIYAYQNWEWFRNTVDAVAAFMRDTVWPILQDVFNWLRDNVPPILQGIADVFTTSFEVVRTVVQTVTDAIRVIWDHFGVYIVSYIEGVWETIKAIVQAAIDIIRGIIQTVTALISGDWSGAWDGIKQILSGAWDGITGIVSGGIEGIKATLGLAWESVKLTASIAWEGFKTTLSDIWDAIETRISDGIDAIIGFVASLPGNVASAIGDGFSAIWDAFAGVINDIIDAWNDLKFPSLTVGGQSLGPLGDLPAFTFGGWNLPDFPYKLHSGGEVPGSPGDEVMTVLLAGETVRTARQERMLQQVLAARGDGARTGMAFNGPVTFESGIDVDAAMRIVNFHLAVA